MATVEQMREAGFSDAEIMADAGFSPEEIQSQGGMGSGIRSGIEGSNDEVIHSTLKQAFGDVLRGGALGGAVMSDAATYPIRQGGYLAGMKGPFFEESMPVTKGIDQYVTEQGFPHRDDLQQRVLENIIPYNKAAIGRQMLAGAGAGIGQWLGEQAAPDSRTVQILSALAGGKAADSFSSLGKWGAKKLGYVEPFEKEVLTRLPVQKGLEIAERNDYLTKPIDQIKKIGPVEEKALTEVASQSDPANLMKSISAQLEVGAKENSLYQKQASNFSEDLPVLMEQGIFNTPRSIDEMKQVVAEKLEALGTQRETTVKQLQDDIFKLNKGVGKVKDMTGIIMPKDLAPTVKELRSRIANLKINESSAPLATAIETQMESILRDVAPKVDKATGNISITTPTAALQMTKNLNEVRKILLKEFNALPEAKRVVGDVVTNTEGSIEAISKLQQALYKAIEEKLGSSAIKRNTGIDPETFTKLNRDYGALKSFEDVLDTYSRKTDLKRVPPDLSKVDPLGSQDFGFNPNKGMAGNAIENLVKLFSQKEELPQALRMAQYARGRETNPLQNISDMLYLSKNPIEYRPNVPPSTSNIIDGRILAAILQQQGQE